MKDLFEEWIRAQPERKDLDPQFGLRPVLPSEFEKFYRLLDSAFGIKRNRAICDWIYRDNPCGIARCMVVVEKSSGEFVRSTAIWPWPAARGGSEEMGTLLGDTVTAPRFQRQSVFRRAPASFRLHPFYPKEVAIGWPNATSVKWLRGVGRETDTPERTGRRKLRREHNLCGPIPRATLYLRARARLVRQGWPRLLAGAAGVLLDGRRSRHGSRSSATSADLRVEAWSHFDSTVEPLANDALRRNGIWHPRSADFLNWRYHAHPTHRYRALALLHDEALLGYAVLKSEGERATLMEFVTQSGNPEFATTLLDAVVAAAREEECVRIDTFATRGWPHWPLLRARGFLERNSEYYVYLRDRLRKDPSLADWQILPGDHDTL